MRMYWDWTQECKRNTADRTLRSRGIRYILSGNKHMGSLALEIMVALMVQRCAWILLLTTNPHVPCLPVQEDADLYSINYLHFGAPKVWYCVPPSQKSKFERMCQSVYPELHKACPAFMRHKDIMLSPALLRTYGVEYMQVINGAHRGGCGV